MELYTASRQWSTRPADERFTSLHALAAFANYQRANTRRLRLANRGLSVAPSTSDAQDIAVFGPNGHAAKLTHWAFGQLCSRAGVPASYITNSRMPGALAADCLNWGLHYRREVEDLSVLLRKNDHGTWLAAVNGPEYGPVWDADIANTLVEEFGDGVTGDWRVPGEFGHKLDAVTPANTTLYASDRDMWCFLADEDRRIELPSRRNGESGSLARGFYISNSEVGAGRLVLGMFLFDYVCCNRIIWGASQLHEIKIRHTSGAPNRWLEEVKPLIETLRHASAGPIESVLRQAQAQRIDKDIESFLTSRFGVSAPIIRAHETDEARPIETVWDAVVGATAYARALPHVDARVKVERVAGTLLNTFQPIATAAALMGV